MVTPTGATPRATSRTWPRLPGQAAGASTGTHTSACGRALLDGSRAAGARRLRARRGRARSRGAALLDALSPQRGCTRWRSVRSFPCGDRTAQSEGGRGWRDGRELDIPDPPWSGGQREPSRFVHGEAFPTRESRLDPVACGRGAKRCGERRQLGFARSGDRDRTSIVVAPAHRRCSTRG